MVGPLKNRVVWLVTGNLHKFNEVRPIMQEHNLAVGMLRKIEAAEIQDDDVKNVASARVLDAVRKSHLSVAVEDAGLFIMALNGFPGPYSSFVFKTIGNEGILRLMKNVADRSAVFKSVVAFSTPGRNRPLCFVGEVEGKILPRKLGTGGFGFDPIFRPNECRKTFAQMSIEEKNLRSHRSSAFRDFAEWYTASF
jgi:XTP/dITP diphosphohydrolase